MNESRWFRENVDWWEREWCLVLSSEARLCWNLLKCRIGAVGQHGRIPKSPLLLLSRQWGVGEESIKQMMIAAVGAGELCDQDGHWSLADPSIFAKDQSNAERQARYRERRKQVETVTEVTGVTLRNGSNGTRQDNTVQDNNPPIIPPTGGKRERKKFVPPTPVEVAAYCAETGMPKSEGRKFFDHYTANGWKVGKNPMVDWKAAVRNWKSRLDENAPKGASYLDDIQEAS